MKITELIKNSGTDIAVPNSDIDIKAVCYDSRKARAGSLFVCLRGMMADGHDYARSAYERGCRAFVCEREPDDMPSDALLLYSKDTRCALGKLAAAFFGHPERELKLVGITGTKGKTTTA